MITTTTTQTAAGPTTGDFRSTKTFASAPDAVFDMRKPASPR